MLYVLFQLGKDRYALEASRVVEVVPLLTMNPIPQAPIGVAGMIVYRGQAIPAVDLCQLTLGHPARERLSTRIIIVEAGGREEETGGSGSGQPLRRRQMAGVLRQDQYGAAVLTTEAR